MQINENEARDDETREILDYYRGLPERSSQEAIVEMLRELQDIHGCISPYMLEQAAEVEQYIRTIENSRMRRIIQYRVIDGLSWYEVADRIGGKATSESCRKYFERFLGKC